VKQFIKIISFSYLIVLSIALLIPLDLFIITQSVKEEISNNTAFIIHLVLFFILYLFFYFSFVNNLINHKGKDTGNAAL